MLTNIHWLYITNIHLSSGRQLTYPSEKYDIVSWDDEIPNEYGKIKYVPNHQPVKFMVNLWNLWFNLYIYING